jgi:heme-degrading monooxygenase HmoA
MYTRVLTWRNAKNIDDAVGYLRDKAVPTAKGLAGYRGGAASADRAGAIVSVLTLWETEEDREAGFAALSQAREEATRIVGGDLTVENFEDVVTETSPTPPTVGSALQVRSVSMDPAKVDENIAFFKGTVLPQITANPGFRSLHNMIDRKTGKGSVGSAWADEASMRAAVADAESRLQQAADRGVTLGETSYREILYIDFP